MHGDRESFGATLDCIYVVFMYMFLACDVFIVYELYMLGEDTFFILFYIFYALLFLVSHMIHLLLIYIMRLFMIYAFYFLFCEIKNLLLFYLYFPYMRLCVCVECFRNIQVYLIVLLSKLAIDR